MNKIIINNETVYKRYSYLKEVLEYTLELEKINNAEFSLIFVNKERIKELNKEYRGINKITDVISFAFEDNNNLLYNKHRLLGDIYICIPKMREQAVSCGHSEKRELAFLAVHGLLHLLGYNHETKEEEIIMMTKGERVLNGKNITR